MRYKKKLIILFLLVIGVTVMQYTFPGHPHIVSLYDKYFFRPYQSLRNLIFGYIPISVGDLLYLAGGILIITLLVRWVCYIIKFKTHKHYLGASLLNTIIILGIVYVLFILGWGANYYKPKLSTFWHFERYDLLIKNDSEATVTFNRYLIDKLNYYAPHYHGQPFKVIDKLSQLYYKEYISNQSKLNGLKAKPSIFGYLMQNFGIQGYYNPFTGEAQVNRFLPEFMLPFVICHEMAHQSGIAAEDDANLLAYVLGTTVRDTAFNYSCYLNLWLYTHNRLYMENPKLAMSTEKELNKLTMAHIDTLKKIRQRYRSILSRYSTAFYDGYLRMQDQKDGIESYGNVVFSAWIWEQRRKLTNITHINIP